MIRKFNVIFALLLLPFFTAVAQPNASLKFVKELPKDLFTDRTAAIITVVTTESVAEALKKYDEISRKLKADNQQMGFNLVHISNGDLLNTPAGMLEQANALNRLTVEKIFFIDYVNIPGTGSRENYKLVITPYNKTSTFITENQRAFSLQAETYERLMGLLLENISDYPSGFFDKGANPNAATSKVNLAHKDNEVIGDHRTPPTMPDLPEIYLAAEDINRGKGGTQRNFYYSIAGQDKNAGYFGQNIREDMAASPEAIRYLNRYRTDKWLYLAGWTVVAGSIVGYASQVYQDIGTSYLNDTQKVFAATGVLAILSNTLVTRNTNLHFKKAVDEYNIFTLTYGKTGFRTARPDHLQLGAMPVPGKNSIAPAIHLTWKIDR